MNRILVVEDEPRISAFIAKGLKAEGFTVTVADFGPSWPPAERAATWNAYDVAGVRPVIVAAVPDTVVATSDPRNTR